MRYLFIVLLLPTLLFAQQKNCSNSFIEKKVKDAVRTYLDDEYEINSTDYFTAAPQQKAEFKKNFDSDYEYVILLVTSKRASQGIVEVLDKNRLLLEKEVQQIHLESDFVELEFEPDYDEPHYIRCAVSYNQTTDNCCVLVVLKRELEDEPKRK